MMMKMNSPKKLKSEVVQVVKPASSSIAESTKEGRNEFEELEIAIKLDPAFKKLEKECTQILERAIARGKALEYQLFNMKCTHLITQMFDNYAKSRNIPWDVISENLKSELKYARRVRIEVEKHGEWRHYLDYFRNEDNGGFTKDQLRILKQLKDDRNILAHPSLRNVHLLELKDELAECLSMPQEHREALERLLEWAINKSRTSAERSYQKRKSY